MQQSTNPPEGQQVRDTLSQQDPMQQVIDLLGCLVDTQKLLLQQVLVMNVPIQVEGPHQVAMQGIETPPSMASSSSKVRRPKTTSLSVKNEPFKRREIHCWKCKEGHYPKRCPQLKHTCYF